MKPFLSWHRWMCGLLVWSAATVSRPVCAQVNAPLYEAPPLEVGSYLGGSGVESAAGIAVNRNGDVYLVANTDSDDFAWQDNDQYLRATKGSSRAQSTLEHDYSRRTPRDGSLRVRPEIDRSEVEQRDERDDDYSGRDGRWDFVVIKLGSRGTRLEWVARFGGAGDDFARGIAVDERGDAYIAGTTDSPDLFDGIDNQGTSRIHGRRDAFLLKLDAQGARVEYGAYLGGSGDDFCRAVAVDRGGRAVLIGDTASDDFPVRNGVQNRARGGVDAWAARFDARGNSLDWATYLGGTDNDFGRAVAIAEDGAVWLAGDTRSSDFPTRFGAQSRYHGEGDAWLARLNASGSVLEYASFIGGSGADAARGLATRGGRAVVVGYTASDDFPVRNGLPSFARGRWDVFVAQAEANRTDWNFSTLLGGSEADFASSVAIDARGDVLVAGQTFSSDFPTRGFVAQRGEAEAFVAKIATGASGTIQWTSAQSTLRLLWTELLGGSQNESGRGVAIDERGRVFVVGQTNSGDFPLRLALQTDNAGRDDLFFARFDGSGRGLEPYPDAPYSPGSPTYNPYPYPYPGYPAPGYPTPNYPYPNDPYYDPYRDPYDDPYRGRARLELRLSQDVVSETAGARRVYGEVYRYVPDDAAYWDYNRDRAMTVYLESTDPRRVRVPETVTISRRRRSASFPIEIIDTERDDGNSDITIYARKPGFQIAEAILRVKDNDSATLSLSISPDTFRESGGPRAAKGVVRRNTSYRGALVVELSSSDARRVRVPSRVTIPDGSPIAAFPIEAVAGATQGTQNVSITARARGFKEATAGVTVTDDDRVDARLTLSINQSTLREEKGERAAIATITRNALTEQAMTIEVFSSDTSRLRVPNTVVIPARSTSVQFAVATVDNGLREGTRAVTITARKPAFQTATVTVQILDDESGANPRPTPGPAPTPIVAPTPRPTPTERPVEAPTVSIRLNASSIPERGTVTGVVRRTGNSTSAMTVYLSTSDSSEARVPSSVVIPAGATEATFTVSATRDGIVDGTRQVRISASKGGLGSDTAVLSILDDDRAAPAGNNGDKADREAREKAERDKAEGEKVAREKANRDREVRDRETIEKAEREKREKAKQDQQVRDKAEQNKRDQEARDAKENAAREAKERGRLENEKAEREKRDKTERDKAERDQREKEARDREAKEREAKDREAKERAARDKEARDREARAKAEQDQAERDKRDKEARDREAKGKEVKPKERKGFEIP